MKPLGELLVADYMTPGAVTVAESERLIVAIRLLNDNKISVVPIVNDQDKVVGILSNSDLIDHVYEIQSDVSALRYVSDQTQKVLIELLLEHGETTFVRDVMTTPVETTMPESNLVLAARKLTECKYHHLPVVDEDDVPVGMLATSDFVRAVADYGKLLAGN